MKRRIAVIGMVQKVYFNVSYKLGFAEWDSHSPQPDLVCLQESGTIQGLSVLDIGCGSGDNAIYLAQKGHKVTGIDSSKSAISAARQRASASNVKIAFHVTDALNLSSLNEAFDTVIDYGLYHNFRDKDISAYITSLSQVLSTGGQLVMQCFSENGPRDNFGPRQVERGEIEKTFSEGWRIERIEAATTRKGPVPAWVSIIRRV